VEVTRIVEVTPTPPPAPTPRFTGVTLTLIDNPEGQTEAMIALQKRCEEKTGARLNVEVVPHDQVRSKLLAALVAKLPTYDLFYIESSIWRHMRRQAMSILWINSLRRDEGRHPALRREGSDL
jgi:ABC-type glycerol-3-phosphate transport system substrate-binding protein